MMHKWAATVVLLFSVSWAAAQGMPPEADTFLWKAQKSGRPTVYLLGTLHVGKVGAVLPTSFRRALKASRQLVVESDPDQLALPQYAAQAAELSAMMSDKRSLQQSLGEKRLAELNKMGAQSQDGLHFSARQTIAPWVVWLTMQTLYTPKGYSARYGVDNLLMQSARQQGKPIIPLEQLQPLYTMRSIPEDKLLRSLDAQIRYQQALLQDEREMMADYQAGAAKKLWRQVSEPKYMLRYLPEQDKPFWQDMMLNRLLAERNQAWMMQLVSVLPKQPTLVAVGSGHLFGEQGLVRKMRLIGYTVTPVMPSEN